MGSLKGKRALVTISWLALCPLAACAEAEDAKRVELAVVTDGQGLVPVTNDLGYAVELASARVVADDIELAIAGEAHGSVLRRISDALVPSAHAHPGHFQAGEVTGELRGHFVLRFVPGEVHELGFATLLVGKYRSAKLTFGRASDDDVEGGDALLGHTALLAGSATKNGAVIAFTVTIDSPPGRELIGVPFEHVVSESSSQTLALRLSTRDPVENDTLFDGVDFAALDLDADGQVAIDAAASDDAAVSAYDRVRRAFQTHDHFVMEAQPW